MSIIQWIRSRPFISKIYKQSILPRAIIKFDRIFQYMPPNSHVLDIGAGNAGLALLLKNKGYQVQALDIIDHSFYSEIEVELYDGVQMPYAQDAFDFSLVITVLHHIEDPVSILKEAIRVSKKVILMEDIYSSTWNKYLLFFVDSLVNFEFRGHPHTNKSDAAWEEVFRSLGVRIEEKRVDRILGIFQQVTYVLNPDTEEF